MAGGAGDGIVEQGELSDGGEFAQQSDVLDWSSAPSLDWASAPPEEAAISLEESGAKRQKTEPAAAECGAEGEAGARGAGGGGEASGGEASAAGLVAGGTGLGAAAEGGGETARPAEPAARPPLADEGGGERAESGAKRQKTEPAAADSGAQTGDGGEASAAGEELVKIRPPTRPHDGWTPEETDTLQKIVSRDGIPKTASAWEDLAAEYNRSVSSRRRTGGSLKQRVNRLKKAAESAGLAPAEYPPEYKGQGRAKQRAAEREKPKAMAMEENKPTKVALVGKWISIEYEVKHGKARWYKGQVHKYDASNDRYLVKEAPLPRPVPNPRLFLAVSPELNVWRKKNDTDCFALPWPDIVGDRWAGLGRFAPERRVQDGASARQAHSQDRTQGHTERGRPLWLHAISVATQ